MTRTITDFDGGVGAPGDGDQDHWAKVGTLFAKALSLSSKERAEFVADVCGDEMTLRRELESLLAAHGSLDDAFLDGEAVSEYLDAEGEPSSIGSIGPWRVEEEIGRGGMGVVYRASRDDGQFEQRVALKLIKRGMDSDQILRRFLRERQILAAMEHPGIARLLDGGVTREGRPWLALEYVEGTRLTSYCDEQNLGLEARLRLFSEVCEAVEYAHRNLVVHRDLKPSNILVDHSGRVKLLDFGIATLLDDDGSASETRTSAEGRLVTPGYGAPELVLGKRITTATDVYSLGVILYELLSGQLPYEFEKGRLAAMALALNDSQPPKLSELAAASAGDGDPPRPSIDRELDTIAIRAIQAEPDRRYVSAAALRDDVERYLNDEPVLACPDSLAYRLQKWGRRHRTFMIAGALVAISVVIGFGATLWQAGIAADERDLARQEAAQTQEVKEFIIDLFRSTDPRDLEGAELTAERLLSRGLERVRGGLESRPDLRLELLTAIAEAAMLLGDYKTAESVFLEALEVEVGNDSRDQLRVALALNGLGETYASLKENAKAVEQHRRALALRLEFDGPESADAAQSYNNLGVALADENIVDEAVEAYENAHRIQEKVLGETDPKTLVTMGNLGMAHRMQGNYQKAEELLRTVIDRISRSEGPDHPNMIGYQSQLASISRRLGNFKEAERLWGRSLDLSRQVWGEEHPITLDMVNNYAVISHLLGNDSVAAELMRWNLEISIEQLGLKHRYVPLNYDNLASMVLELGDVEEAIELLETAQELHAEVSPPYYVVMSDIKHAQALLAAGQLDAALRLADGAVAQERGLDAPNRGRLARVLMVAASVDAAVGRLEEAEAKYHETLEFHRQLGSDGSLTAASAHLGLARLYLVQSCPEEAHRELTRADEIWSESLPTEHWRRSELRVAQGEYWLRMGETEKGLELMDEGIAQLQAGRGEEHWRTQQAIRSREAVTGPALASCAVRF